MRLILILLLLLLLLFVFVLADTGAPGFVYRKRRIQRWQHHGPRILLQPQVPRDKCQCIAIGIGADNETDTKEGKIPAAEAVAT